MVLGHIYIYIYMYGQVCYLCSTQMFFCMMIGVLELIKVPPLFLTLSKCVQIDTKDILFICGGAFVDIEKTISERYD